MTTQITEGIKVSIVTEYQPEHFSGEPIHYRFIYRVIIENCSAYTAQLLSRHWFIHNVDGYLREEKGEGVVGKKPILEPGEKHQYLSICNLRTPVGKMRGVYRMERVYDGKVFEVRIPEFTLMLPHLYN